MKKEIRDIAASVRQRLFNRAQETHRPFDELFQYYSMERFLYRLSRSDYAGSVILKGALMLIVWEAPHSRATRDIDLLGRFENTIDHVTEMVQEICRINVEPDGMIFDPGNVIGERIKEDADYEGVRVRFTGRLGQARSVMQIDFGFGDTVFPEPTQIEYPSLLGMPRPLLTGYTRETVIAEKFEAMVTLGLLNSRMKDFYDIWLLANQFDFDGKVLLEAIKKTFSNRKIAVPAAPVALSSEFSRNPEKTAQWKAFIRKSILDHTPEELEQIIEALRPFLIPLAQALANGDPFDFCWKAPGPWTLYPPK